MAVVIDPRTGLKENTKHVAFFFANGDDGVMTSHTYLPPRGSQLASLDGMLTPGSDAGYELRGPEGVFALPPEVYEVLQGVVHAMARGQAVTITPSEQVVTTQQAADILGVSRPTVVKFIEGGRLPAERVSNRRTLRLEDVLAFREVRRQEQYDAIHATSVDLDDEAGLEEILEAARAARKAVSRKRRP